MSWNGSGTWAANSTGLPVVTSTVISSTMFNAFTADVATGLTNCMTKDGQSTPTANISMHNFKITSLAAPTAAGDALTSSQSIGAAGTVLQSTGSALVYRIGPIPAAIIFGI